MLSGQGETRGDAGAWSHPARTRPDSARMPSARPRLSSRIDFPAPVSPVSTPVRPEPKERSSRSIRTTSRMDSAVSIVRRRSGHQKIACQARLKKPGPPPLDGTGRLLGTSPAAANLS